MIIARIPVLQHTETKSVDGISKDSGSYTSILKLQDKTLFCAFEDNFKQNGVFWRQHLPAVRIWTWPKYNKHHHDLKNQLCRFIDMYIGKIFWQRHHVGNAQKKRFGDRVRSCSVRFLTQTRLALLSSAQLFDVFFIDCPKVFDFTI